MQSSTSPEPAQAIVFEEQMAVIQFFISSSTEAVLLC